MESVESLLSLYKSKTAGNADLELKFVEVISKSYIFITKEKGFPYIPEIEKIKVWRSILEENSNSPLRSVTPFEKLIPDLNQKVFSERARAKFGNLRLKGYSKIQKREFSSSSHSISCCRRIVRAVPRPFLVASTFGYKQKDKMMVLGTIAVAINKANENTNEQALEKLERKLEENIKMVHGLLEKGKKTDTDTDTDTADRKLRNTLLEDINEMEKSKEDYKNVIRLSNSGIDLDVLQDLFYTLVTEGIQQIVQIVIGILTLDPVLVYMGLSNILPILFKLFGSAAIVVIRRQKQKINVIAFAPT